MHIAIIGAGISGLACADVLRHSGHKVTLFDKGRGPGGRMSTRRVVTPFGETAFDHGATHFTARSTAFRQRVKRWHECGVVAPWPVAGSDAWVGTPSMNAPIKELATGHDIHWSSRVSALKREAERWIIIRQADQFGPFDAVVTAIPPEQAAPLLSLHDFQMAREAMAVQSHAMWSTMVLFSEPVAGVDDFIRGRDPIAFAVRNSSKPGRSPGEAWVIQANWQWSRAYVDADAAEVGELLLDALAAVTDQTLPAPLFATSHRWLFAQPSGNDQKWLWNDSIALGACGDWLSHGFVEYAWQSGHGLGKAMVA